MSSDAIIHAFKSALEKAEAFDAPYRHWLFRDIFPEDVRADLLTIEFPVADPGDVSGKRELHNDTRHYFDQENIAAMPVAHDVAHALQSPEMVAAFEKFFDVDLTGTYLRLEYAQDVGGFWLEPHTDLGVKKITVLIYLSDAADHNDMGTDIYSADKKWVKRSPFESNMAMSFVPGEATYHGFEKRDIPGVRKTLILNYVTDEWRDREQLSFPEQAVSAS